MSQIKSESVFDDWLRFHNKEMCDIPIKFSMKNNTIVAWKYLQILKLTPT